MIEPPHARSGRARGIVPAAARYIEPVLAIVGGLTLFAAAVTWTTSKIAPSDLTAIVKPICERFTFADSVAGVGPDLRMIGVKVFVDRDLSGARLRLRGLRAIAFWGMHSNGLSQPEVRTWLRSLPTGPVGNEVVTPVLPTLPGGTEATLTALATVQGESACAPSPDFAEMFGGEGKLYHVDPTILPFRGASIGLTNLRLAGAVAALYGGVALLIFWLGKRYGLFDSEPDA